MERVDKNQRFQEYAPLVKRVAHHMKQRLPDCIEIDDLIQVGMMGLMEVTTRYDELYGVQFDTFAMKRIRGSMLDELRHEDWAPKSLRRAIRHFDEVTTKLQHQLGRPPNEVEMAKELCIPLAKCQKIKFESNSAQLMHYDNYQESYGTEFLDQHESDINADPLNLLQDKYFNEALSEAIGKLPKAEQRLMDMRYEQGMNLCEIGKAMGVNTSRACQIQKHAVEILRSSLKEHFSID